MSDRHPTRIGRVRQVLGSKVTVELDCELAGVAPVFQGQLQTIGQIGSIVRIPQGIVDLIATVTMVSISELSGTQSPVETLHSGERWLQLQLLGEIDRGTARFQRGVGTYPGLDDPVHFALIEDLTTVFPPPSERYVRIGHASADGRVPIALDVEKLVMHHSAIVGSTGSGKTSAVASILQSLDIGGWSSAKVIVVDTHGEYPRALGDRAAVRSVLDTGDDQLQVPFWALPAASILTAFTDTTPGATTAKTFASLVTEARRDFAETCTWLTVAPESVTADSPIPFDIKQVWYNLDFENRETRHVKNDPSSTSIVDVGNASSLRPATFEPYGAGGKPPHQSPNFGLHGSIPDLLRIGLKDPRLSFLRGPEGAIAGPDPLELCMQQWLGMSKPTSVLDFSGVPSHSAELAIGVMLHLLFETAIRSTTNNSGIGRVTPVLVVLEEAHRYLNDTADTAARAAVNRIAREGRKYGIGLLLVTQRPSELPDTALSQCGTLIALRLSNSSDQAKIKSALPDNVAGLAETLPSLRTGEAVISGEALVLPARVTIDRPSPLPLAEDPSLQSWRTDPTVPDLSSALSSWRGDITMTAEDEATT